MEAVAKNSFQLKTRIEQDSHRDPVDALNDASHLLSLLLSLEKTLSDPALRYMAGSRIREDLSRTNLSLAAIEARLLVQYNERRIMALEPVNQSHG